MGKLGTAGDEGGCLGEDRPRFGRGLLTFGPERNTDLALTPGVVFDLGKTMVGRQGIEP